MNLSEETISRSSKPNLRRKLTTGTTRPWISTTPAMIAGACGSGVTSTARFNVHYQPKMQRIPVSVNFEAEKTLRTLHDVCPAKIERTGASLKETSIDPGKLRQGFLVVDEKDRDRCWHEIPLLNLVPTAACLQYGQPLRRAGNTPELSRKFRQIGTFRGKDTQWARQPRGSSTSHCNVHYCNACFVDEQELCLNISLVIYHPVRPEQVRRVVSARGTARLPKTPE